MKKTTKQVIDFLSRHKSLFAQQFYVNKIGIFGSYAKGLAGEESDIDIVVEQSKPDLFCLIGVKQVIEEGLGVKADVVRIREKMNPVLKRRIEQDVIYV
jgi:predicted nucleotidyltransferase